LFCFVIVALKIVWQRKRSLPGRKEMHILFIHLFEVGYLVEGKSI